MRDQEVAECRGNVFLNSSCFHPPLLGITVYVALDKVSMVMARAGNVS